MYVFIRAAAAFAFATAPVWADAIAEPIGVRVDNRTEPTLCAEVDNVYVTLSATAIREFTVTARHPAYIGTLVADSSAADYANCNRAEEQFFEFDTRRVTLYEDRAIWLVGYVYERYWRDKDVPVRVGGRVEHGLHMIQLWMQGPRGPEEFLVLYPPDGYWRLRPLTPPHLHFTAYGSSVLIGPVEDSARPIVEVTDVVFDPQARTFRLTFERGGAALITIESAADGGTQLDVRFEGAAVGGVFAGLRSMYVAPANADVSAVGWRGADDAGWHYSDLPDFDAAGDVTQLALERLVVSRHNSSAPDFVFGGFDGGD
jgi:hypothetical protein